MLAMAGRELPCEVPAISGKSWTVLSTTAAQRCHLIARQYEKSVLVLTGGTSDLMPVEANPPGENDTGEQALADMEAYANAARAAGFDKIVALTVTPANWWDADWDVQRLVMNEGIRQSDAWEVVADVAADPRLQDPMDTDYYYDQLHWTAAGNAVAAEVVAPALDSVLAELSDGFRR